MIHCDSFSQVSILEFAPITLFVELIGATVWVLERPEGRSALNTVSMYDNACVTKRKDSIIIDDRSHRIRRRE